MITEAVRESQNEFLNLISGGKHLVIDATNGSRILAEANDLFGYIDSDFKNWDADEPGELTEETPAKVYEMAKEATFTQMFGSLSLDLNNLCFTQAQIIGFVKKYRKWLRSDDYATFFLFKSRDVFFIANVDVYFDGELKVRVYRFEESGVWDAEYRHRVVVPQLA